MDYQLLVNEQTTNPDADLSFLLLDKEFGTLTMVPEAIHVPGIYEQMYLHFFFTNYPDLLQLNVKIIARVLECIPETAKFTISEL